MVTGAARLAAADRRHRDEEEDEHGAAQGVAAVVAVLGWSGRGASMDGFEVGGRWGRGAGSGGCLVAIQPQMRSQSTCSPFANSGLIHCASGTARSRMYWSQHTKTTLPRKTPRGWCVCAAEIRPAYTRLRRAPPYTKLFARSLSRPFPLMATHQIGSHLSRPRV